MRLHILRICVGKNEQNQFVTQYRKVPFIGERKIPFWRRKQDSTYLIIFPYNEFGLVFLLSTNKELLVLNTIPGNNTNNLVCRCFVLLTGHELKYIKYYLVWNNKLKDRAKLFTHQKVFKNIFVLLIFAASFLNEDEIGL